MHTYSWMTFLHNLFLEHLRTIFNRRRPVTNKMIHIVTPYPAIPYAGIFNVTLCNFIFNFNPKLVTEKEAYKNF